eukprot:11175661-Lingulodinium_polyedra.AAC.1
MTGRESAASHQEPRLSARLRLELRAIDAQPAQGSHGSPALCDERHLPRRGLHSNPHVPRPHS